MFSLSNDHEGTTGGSRDIRSLPTDCVETPLRMNQPLAAFMVKPPG